MNLEPQVFIAVCISVALAACGGGGPDPEKGEEVYALKRDVGLSVDLACKDCHVFGERRPGDGPSFVGIAETAATRVEGMSAAEYIRQSVREPSAYIPEGYFDHVMPKVYAELLTDEEIDNLIAFLLAEG